MEDRDKIFGVAFVGLAFVAWRQHKKINRIRDAVNFNARRFNEMVDMHNQKIFDEAFKEIVNKYE